MVLVIIGEINRICCTSKEVINTLQDQTLGFGFLTDEFAKMVIPEVSLSAVMGNENEIQLNCPRNPSLMSAT